jgi:short-subunit dehydrogenase
MVLPGMTARYEATKQRSLIINLSSTAAILPMPMMSLYGATKAFNDWLSRALSYECEPAVQIVSFRPGVVNTNLPKAANVKGSGPGVIETEAFAKAAMNCLNQRTCSPHWVHGTMAWAMENIAWPEFMIPVVFWGWKKFSTDWDQGFKKRD